MLWLHTWVVYWICAERHDSTFGQSIDPKERRVSTDWLFSVHKIISNFGCDPKAGSFWTFRKKLMGDPEKLQANFPQKLKQIFKKPQGIPRKTQGFA